jgi:hypothetical protein
MNPNSGSIDKAGRLPTPVKELRPQAAARPVYPDQLLALADEVIE